MLVNGRVGSRHREKSDVDPRTITGRMSPINSCDGEAANSDNLEFNGMSKLARALSKFRI